MSFREKFLALEDLGVDRLLRIHFNEELRSTSAQAFLERIFVRGLGVRYIVLGDDFRFGNDREGDIKLIDFAVAKKIRTGLGRLFGGGGSIQGTRSYMSPEQIRGKTLDGRADIYSLGCVFYELLVGKPPFTGDSPNDLLNKHLSASIPSPLVANDNATPEIAALVKKMMAKRPDDRPESMWDVLKILRGTKIFKKPPRIPDESIFDTIQLTGRVENPT
jgi:serine/threonine protein kinase